MLKNEIAFMESSLLTGRRRGGGGIGTFFLISRRAVRPRIEFHTRPLSNVTLYNTFERVALIYVSPAGEVRLIPIRRRQSSEKRTTVYEPMLEERPGIFPAIHIYGIARPCL